ncbi:MAG: hypothetical protein CBB77_11020 [Hyphomonas sp. TMED17]|nr:MAG: hypothetical protein CBB77_11020 [Hyphomonas sp. TMED17]
MVQEKKCDEEHRRREEDQRSSTLIASNGHEGREDHDEDEGCDHRRDSLICEITVVASGW